MAGAPYQSRAVQSAFLILALSWLQGEHQAAAVAVLGMYDPQCLQRAAML